ncbi:hypothetical protein HK100_007147 [Physocladia obscura]|uniref:Uncharacterized protein n=1 Tax=Physocladia obscura TaxID=109957 RepID=A0AAD5SRB8_9FUNG|nr:hypothetical protein HK100_007147 [Physocladia obscura]
METNTASSTAIQSVLKFLTQNGVLIQASDVLQLLEALEELESKFSNSTATATAIFLSTVANATTDLRSAFEDAYHVVFLSLLFYPVGIFALAFLIKEFSLAKK